MSVSSSDGVELAVHDLGGRGPTLLVSHATGFHGRCYLPVAAALADRFHTIAFEGSISIVNTLSATRLLRKGYETSILLYGPGVTMGFQKGFPTLGDEAFPGHLFVNQRLAKFMDEGGKIYGCRFSTQALYGQTEKAFIPGIIPIGPLDVLDCILMHKKANAVIMDSWTV